MAAFTAQEICLAVNGQLLAGTAGQRGDGVSTDTRTLTAGNIFIALSGEQFDGHHFISQAVEKGAAILVVSQPVQAPEGVAVILSDNTLRALQQMAGLHRRRFAIPVIAVTGSNGKTTTKDMTAAVLASRLNVLKTHANFNNEIGLPLTLLNLTADHQAAVVEMGMRGKGEIAELAAIACPTIAVLTNVGETHIELLGSVENIAAAKAELVEALDARGVAVLNGDNRYVRNMARQVKGRVILYGLQEEADIRAQNTKQNERGIAFDCYSPQGVFSVKVPAAGTHNVYNALAAIAVGLELGLSGDDIAAGLANFVPSAMRLAIEEKGGYTIINDAYNASPLSMAAALDTLVAVAGKRKIAVLGDMLELGPIARSAHEEIGQKAAQAGLDAVITLGPLAQYIAQAAKRAGVPAVTVCDSHDEAQQALKSLLQPGDTVLVKGSRGMQMEKILAVFN